MNESNWLIEFGISTGELCTFFVMMFAILWAVYKTDLWPLRICYTFVAIIAAIGLFGLLQITNELKDGKFHKRMEQYYAERYQRVLHEMFEALKHEKK